MSLDLAVPETTASGVVLDHEGILRSLNLNARDPKTQAMLLICERYQIDPLMKHAVLISGNIYITRDGYLHVAHRSGQFDGIEVLETGETPTHFTAKVAVYRKDMSHPFTYTGRFPKSERMAKTFGPEMAVKVAEVQALRRAFNVTGVAASDERWDVDPSEVTHAVAESSGGEANPGGDPVGSGGAVGSIPAPASLPARSSAADPETGEVTTRRRPPPNAALAQAGVVTHLRKRIDALPDAAVADLKADWKGAGLSPLSKLLASDLDDASDLVAVYEANSSPTSVPTAPPAADKGGHDPLPDVGSSPGSAPTGDQGEASQSSPVPSAPGASPKSRNKRTTALMAAATQRFPDRAERLAWATIELGRGHEHMLATFTGLSAEDESVLLDALGREAGGA